jgi:hypothetical protein
MTQSCQIKQIKFGCGGHLGRRSEMPRAPDNFQDQRVITLYFWKWCVFAYFLCTVVLSTSEKIAYMYTFKKNLLLRNHWINCNQTLVEWSLGGPLPNFCPVIPTSNQDGHQAKNRKRGGEFFFKSSPLKLLSQSQPNFAEMTLGWSPSRGPPKDHSTKVWLQLIQWFLRRRFLCEFPIGSYVKLSSVVGPSYGIFLWTLNFCQFWPIMQIRKKGGMKLKKNLLLWNYWANLNQILLK